MKVSLNEIVNNWAEVARIFGNMRSLDINGFKGEAEITIDGHGHVSIDLGINPPWAKKAGKPRKQPESVKPDPIQADEEGDIR